MSKTRCKICAHPQVEQIKEAIARRTPDTIIVAQYGNTFSALTLASHRKDCIKHALVAAEAALRVNRGIDVKEIVFENYEIFQKAKRACVRWLTDPDDSNEFTIDPRATEIDIVYYDLDDCDERGKPTRKKAPLQELLNKLNASGHYEVKTHYDKSIDIRRYVLEVLNTQRGDMEFWAKLYGLFQKERENEFDEREKFDREVERIMGRGWDRENAERIAVDANPTGLWVKFLSNAI